MNRNKGMIFRCLKYLKFVIPVVLVTGMVVVFLAWSNAPNQGTIANASTAKAPAAYFDKTLDGTYMKFQHSSKYLLTSEIPSNGDLERYTLSADTRYDKRILISVTNLPDGRLDSNGAYIYRQSSKDVYGMRKLQIGSELYTVWVRNDGTEQTAMIPRGNKVAIISSVTANPKDDLNTEMDALLNSFRLK